MKGVNKLILVLEIIFIVAGVLGIFFAVMAVITEGWSLRLIINIGSFVVMLTLGIIQFVLVKKQSK